MRPAHLSARLQGFQANRAQRRFASGRQEGLGLEPVLTFNLPASPQGTPHWCKQ
jgi:hypothetical protein